MHNLTGWAQLPTPQQDIHLPQNNFMNKIFEMFCEIHEVDGALKVRLSRIYNETHNLDSLEVELRNLGNEKTLAMEKEEVIALTENLDNRARLIPDEKISLARAHSSNELKKRIFGIKRERDGD